MMFNAIPRWIPVAVLGAAGVLAYIHFADDVIGGGFFALVAAIVVYRMARRGVPLSEALVDVEDFGDRVTVQGSIVHFADGDGEWFDSVKHLPSCGPSRPHRRDPVPPGAGRPRRAKGVGAEWH